MGKRGPQARPTAERFWPKVNKTDGCWEWTGSRTDKGYGKFTQNEFGTSLAHRVAYLLDGGELQIGQVLRHYVCDNPPCVRPDHLRPGSQLQNITDMISKGRDRRGRNTRADWTHCIRGHEFTEDNIYWNKSKDGKRRRSCRRCKLDRMKAA